jgi:hypothetical protein
LEFRPTPLVRASPQGGQTPTTPSRQRPAAVQPGPRRGAGRYNAATHGTTTTTPAPHPAERRDGGVARAGRGERRALGAQLRLAGGTHAVAGKHRARPSELAVRFSRLVARARQPVYPMVAMDGRLHQPGHDGGGVPRPRMEVGTQTGREPGGPGTPDDTLGPFPARLRGLAVHRQRRRVPDSLRPVLAPPARRGRVARRPRRPTDPASTPPFAGPLPRLRLRPPRDARPLPGVRGRPRRALRVGRAVRRSAGPPSGGGKLEFRPVGASPQGGQTPTTPSRQRRGGRSRPTTPGMSRQWAVGGGQCGSRAVRPLHRRGSEGRRVGGGSRGRERNLGAPYGSLPPPGFAVRAASLPG